MTDNDENTEKRRQLNRIVGFIVIIIFLGLIGASYQYIKRPTMLEDSTLNRCSEPTKAEQVVFEKGEDEEILYTFPGEEKWDVRGKILTISELQERYVALYNFTKPYVIREEIKAITIPTGPPDIYGLELEVSFDGDSNKMISILRAYEDAPLNEIQMKRYVDIGSKISCEYCCSAKTLVLENGQRACGCAHSYAMRGLAKYLIINHPAEYTDDAILNELAKWKSTYFPKQSIQKVLKTHAETGKVDLSVLAEMPSMVGNC